ncbi:hypothetical protein [Mesohalobacter halotolerans]|nr:hypothetical protein [Mesohalobacter halotolerans]MBS3737954.1 hypothetical protein [Psychroflexus sp.]
MKTTRISNWQKFVMRNPIIQFVKFVYISLKVMIIVAGGHDGTRTS